MIILPESDEKESQLLNEIVRYIQLNHVPNIRIPGIIPIDFLDLSADE